MVWVMLVVTDSLYSVTVMNSAFVNLFLNELRFVFIVSCVSKFNIVRDVVGLSMTHDRSGF